MAAFQICYPTTFYFYKSASLLYNLIAYNELGGGLYYLNKLFDFSILSITYYRNFTTLCIFQRVKEGITCMYTLADPGVGGKGGVHSDKQGRSPCSRHEVRSVVGQGGGTRCKEHAKQIMLRLLLKHSKIRILKGYIVYT